MPKIYRKAKSKAAGLQLKYVLISDTFIRIYWLNANMFLAVEHESTTPYFAVPFRFIVNVPENLNANRKFRFLRGCQFNKMTLRLQN